MAYRWAPLAALWPPHSWARRLVLSTDRRIPGSQSVHLLRGGPSCGIGRTLRFLAHLERKATSALSTRRFSLRSWPSLPSAGGRNFERNPPSRLPDFCVGRSYCGRRRSELRQRNCEAVSGQCRYGCRGRTRILDRLSPRRIRWAKPEQKTLIDSEQATGRDGFLQPVLADRGFHSARSNTGEFWQRYDPQLRVCLPALWQIPCSRPGVFEFDEFDEFTVGRFCGFAVIGNFVRDVYEISSHCST